MTKCIRIENADNSQHKVAVIVQQRGAEGWRETQRLDLSFPTQLAELHIHEGQRIIIEEDTV